MTTQASTGQASTGNAYALLILAALLWGGNAVAGKLATAEWQPFMLTSLRWGLAGIVLLPFAWPKLKRDWPAIRAHLPLLVALGAIGMASFNLLMYLALHTTSAINVSIIQSSMPCMIMVANFLVLRQRVVVWQLVGLGASILGVLIVTTSGSVLDFFRGQLVLGDALMLLACVFYAGYTFGLRWRPSLHWLSYMTVVAASAFAMTIPFSVWEYARTPQTLPSVSAWLLLAYVTIFPTVVSQVAWARGVDLIGSNRAGLFFNLIPVSGAGLAVLLLGETLAWYHILGLLLVLGGITLAERVARD